ncbi:MAG: hypothetical protein E7485_08430 [Ruminococcaceae bacterium]|nr:hypothetical protein [Oscillospiraceae bacterium]
MTQAEKLKRRLPEASDTDIEDLLDSTAAIINNIRNPFGEIPEEIEPRYNDLQLRMAVELFNKEGAEGQTSHSENGVSRAYSSAWVSSELLNEIVPKAAVI